MLLVIFCRDCRFLSSHIKKIKLVCFGYLVSIEACKIVSYEALVLVWLTATGQVFILFYIFEFSILLRSANESVTAEQDLYPQTGIIWSPTGKLKLSGKIWKLPKPWPCFSSKSPVQWRFYLHCISALPVMLVSAKNNSSTDFPWVISLCRIRLRLDSFFWCLTKFKSRYLPYAAGRKGCPSLSIL